MSQTTDTLVRLLDESMCSIRRLEIRLNDALSSLAVAQAKTPSYSLEQAAAIVESARRTNIHMIKEIRALSGAGLKDAKETAEAILQRESERNAGETK